MTVEDRPTVAERYSKATESSNLKVTSERRGDADMLIAAGWAGESLGASLARLRAEFDAVHAQTKGQGNSSATDMLLALMELKTLPGVRQELGSMAVARAIGKEIPIDQATVLKLTGQVLSAFLEPNCQPCDGRGFTGGGRHEQSGPQILCRRCSGTGKRRASMGKTDVERAFAGDLLSDIEEKASRFEQQVARRIFEER